MGDRQHVLGVLLPDDHLEQMAAMTPTNLGEEDLNEEYVDPILVQLTPADIAMARAATNYPAGRNEVVVELEDDEP